MSKAQSFGLTGNRISSGHPDQTALARFKERHYSVDDVAEMWSLESGSRPETFRARMRSVV